MMAILLFFLEQTKDNIFLFKLLFPDTFSIHGQAHLSI